jgi:hypothetical protein
MGALFQDGMADRTVGRNITLTLSSSQNFLLFNKNKVRGLMYAGPKTLPPGKEGALSSPIATVLFQRKLLPPSSGVKC